MTEGGHRRVVLSGGIGAGKSAVARSIEARGIPVIHADTIGHAVLEPEGEAFHAVSAWWPEILLDGHIDRSRLAQIVFEDPQALRQLESMTHPAIAARILNLVAAEEAADLVVVELPLLLPILGDGWTRVVVDAPLETRKQRLVARGMDEVDIEARMAAQPSPQEWTDAAEFVIGNGGSLEDLETEVDRLLEWLKAHSS
ncbi:MAG: dephospho-CoA kinase [Acidimicrobiia bacterium]|nr:dephospho-CoA kinase [Acidimicrobiia bacterium]